MCSIQFETEPGSGERERERDSQRERERELSLGIGLFDASISIISDHLSIQYILAWSWSALSYDPNLCSWRWSLFRSKTLNRSLALRSASILSSLQVWFASLPSLFHLRDFSVTGPKAGQLVSTTHIDCELVIPARVSVQGLEETHRSTVRWHYVHHVQLQFFFPWIVWYYHWHPSYSKHANSFLSSSPRIGELEQEIFATQRKQAAVEHAYITCISCNHAQS